VHTGQHFDKNMSDTFFEELNIPWPDINLGVSGGSQAEQTAGIMIEFEKELLKNPTDLVIVVGDVTSTMACSIVAKKLNTKVAHIEAGIRSWDLTMPEEINRIVTDALADYYFTTTEIANENLRRFGAKEEQIFFVGNVMIDTLLANMARFRKPDIFDALQLKEQNYLMLTMHRPANVDEADKLKKLISEITSNVHELPVIFPIHPRTAKIFADLGIKAKNLHIVPPMGYLEFNYMVSRCKAIVTDSGGITE
jgi:UDP-N-acetylglucosamine 2-epimerase (non-hydrolysing)